MTEAEVNEVAVFLKSFHKKIIDKWQTVFIYQKKSKVRHHPQQNEPENVIVESAAYVSGFTIAINFSNGQKKLVDFLLCFTNRYWVKILIILLRRNLKNLSYKNGNIYWGKNEDIIFPVHLFLEKKLQEQSIEEILYVL